MEWTWRARGVKLVRKIVTRQRSCAKSTGRIRSDGGEWGVWAMEGVSDVRGEFSVWWECGESGDSAEWDGSDDASGLDLRGEVLGAPPFADCAPRRAFKDLANSALVAESITDAAPRQTSNKG